MNSFFSFIIAFTLISGLFLGYFLLFLRKSTEFQKNRWVLLFGIIISTIIPLIHINTPFSFFVGHNVNIVFPVQEISMRSKELTDSYSFLIQMFYGIISAFLFFLFISKIYRIYSLIKRNNLTKFHGFSQIDIDESYTVFSFFHVLFLPKSTEKVTDEIILHEMAHIRQWHSVDVIIIELLKVFFWMNPFIYLYSKLIRMNHEYLADDYVISESVDNQTYIKVLVESIIGKQLDLAHNFNKSLILKRIQMINTNKKPKTSAVRYLAMLPVLLIAFFLFSFDWSSHLPINTMPTVEEITSEDVVKAPEYPDMLNFLRNNIKYPSEAAKNGISGVVYVTALIQKDGNLAKVEVLRGVEASLNAEAVRVVGLMKKWTPGEKNGQKVDMDITIPIKFNLVNKSDK
ncbi:MAG: M56 family metallopeptidase [Bacteroidales bacterium]|nr:M56 family metallopeptidase [Bacteroidales bacterium]